MKKIFLGSIFTAVLLLAGCIALNSYTINHELFSLDVPNQYKDMLVFNVTQQTDLNSDKIIEMEKEKFKNMCGQTESCGTVTDIEPITLNGKNGVKFTVKYDESKIVEYHYDLYDSKNLFSFWLAASNKQEFDDIISTIKFK